MDSHTAHAGHHNTTGPPKDLRAAVRYALEARVVFSWTDEQGVAQKGLGWTRDISPKGVYVVAIGCPPRSATVSLSVQLPVTDPQSRAMSLETRGRVLRVDIRREGGWSGFSVEHERVSLCAS
ncbi:MAG: hypothetical protein LAN59_08825 [Acidobacteriia bacterium]|nr:hypothetical protein [Terriglobia bacterium]